MDPIAVMGKIQAVTFSIPESSSCRKNLPTAGAARKIAQPRRMLKIIL